MRLRALEARSAEVRELAIELGRIRDNVPSAVDSVAGWNDRLYDLVERAYAAGLTLDELG